ncbi:MAG TPA: helix-turn-helix domain-containing protein [Vicinamibacterales bacterium]|nr:helix-turn-helix domain-containing protein [Vicinamibacterales bacterium]
MKAGPPRSFSSHLKSLREAAGYTQEELATIAGLSVHAVSALERGTRRRPQVETVRALSAALDLSGQIRDTLLGSARSPLTGAAVDELSDTSLPVTLTALLGRDADVKMLRRWLKDPTARLITLTGPGGAGKTRLAVEVARGMAAEGASRVVFVPLAAIRNPQFVAPAIAEALGLADVTTLDLPRRIRVACGDHPTLLVVDNLEHVLDAAPLMTDLLSSAALLRVLATSRAPLRVHGEREYAVGPLALATRSKMMSPAALARSPAVRLFIERVRDVQPGFRLNSGNTATVAAICQKLDALPLALELAAPWLKVLTAEELLQRLGQDILFSAVGRRDLPERQQTMNATVAWSYQLLAPDEQGVFRRLAALPGRFPIEAAAAVLAGSDSSAATSEAALRAVAGLIDKSLLIRAETSVSTRPLYQMLETVRAFAAHALSAAGERDEALAGLARYCTGEASLAEAGLVGPAQAEWLHRVRDDLESYRVALTWLIERGRPGDAAGIAAGLMQFWMIRGGAAEGLQWYEQILRLPSLPPVLEAKALVGAAMMMYSLGELGRARTGLTRALALAADAGDAEIVAQAEHLFGHIEHAVGNIGVARDRFTRSVEGFRALGITWGVGNSLNGLAKVALAMGDADEAERLLDQAASVLRQCPWFLALALYRRAVLELLRGHADEAIALVRESLTLYRQLQDKYAIVYVMVPLAAAAVLKGDDLWAARILGARDAVTERTGATIADRWVHALGEQAEWEVRGRLGPDRWARAHAAGRVTSIDAWIRDINAVLRRSAAAV